MPLIVPTALVGVGVPDRATSVHPVGSGARLPLWDLEQTQVLAKLDMLGTMAKVGWVVAGGVLSKE